MNTIAERLASARERAGLTQGQVATRAGVRQGTIGNIESGARKNPRELLAIAKAVGVNPLWLQSGVGPRQARSQPDPDDSLPLTLEKHTVPTSWEALMQTLELPVRFVVAMPDDALLPTIPRGMELVFERSGTPYPGVGVLVADSGGRKYIRRYAEGHQGRWLAQASHTAFVTLDSELDGLELLAVMVGRMSGVV